MQSPRSRFHLLETFQHIQCLRFIFLHFVQDISSPFLSISFHFLLHLLSFLQPTPYPSPQAQDSFSYLLPGLTYNLWASKLIHIFKPHLGGPCFSLKFKISCHWKEFFNTLYKGSLYFRNCLVLCCAYRWKLWLQVTEEVVKLTQINWFVIKDVIFFFFLIKPNTVTT